jgi:hypothetical protein
MQIKALLFDCNHPDNPLGTCSAEAHTEATRTLAPPEDQLEPAKLMIETGDQAHAPFALSRADTRRPS